MYLTALSYSTYKDHKVFKNNKPFSTSEFIGYITNLVKYPPQMIIKIKNALTEWKTYKLYKIVPAYCRHQWRLSKFKSVLKEHSLSGLKN